MPQADIHNNVDLRGTQPPTNRPLTPLSYLSSPVPDLASTLVAEVESEEDENVRFLRSATESTEDSFQPMSSSHSHEDARTRRLQASLNQLQRINPSQSTEDSSARASPSQYSEHDRLQRLQRSLHQLQRVNPPRTTTEDEQSRRDPQTQDRMMRVLSRLSRTEDAGRTYRSGSPYVYDQAATIARPSAGGEEEAELHEIIAELRRENPHLQPEVANIMARSRLDRARDAEVEASNRLSQERQDEARALYHQQLTAHERSLREQSRQERQQEIATLERRLESANRRYDSLRSTAIMQHARSSNSTDRMLRYVREREQNGEAEHQPQAEDNNSSSNWLRITRQDDQPSNHATGVDPWYGQQTIDRYRREYLAGYPGNRSGSDGKSTKPQVSPFLENAVKYLDRIQDSLTYNDALEAAMDNGFANKEFFADKHDDFIMDVSRFPSPSTSSWLQSGVKFAGSQHTTFQPENERSSYRPVGYPSHVSWEPSRPFDATRPWLSHTQNPRLQHEPTVSSSPQPLEHWPVKVTIHSVDETSMTLSGTMEAYDVPNHTYPPPSHTSNDSHSKPRNSPITTYLEGQIIDLRTHSFRTPNTDSKTRPYTYVHRRNASHPQPRPTQTPHEITFPPTTAVVDAANWRRLPPFNSIDEDDEVGRVLLSHDRLAAINDKYIFMRWKERCFIHNRGDSCPNSPRRSVTGLATTTSATHDHGHSHTASVPTGSDTNTNSRSTNSNTQATSTTRNNRTTATRIGEGDDTDTGHGLTISGFYYVSLRRADGAVQGLYFDPSTSPYQCLRLAGIANGGGVGAWGFR